MNTVLGLGFILVFALFLSKITERIKTPAITAYLLLGVFIGPYALKLIPDGMLQTSGFVSNIALSLIAFSIGQNFSKQAFSQIGRPVIWISILAALGAWIFVVTGLLFLGIPFYVCIIFGAISAATAPAALIMVIREYRAKGRFTDILMGVVALDDAWGLVIFSISLAVARAIHLHMSSSLTRVVFSSLLEIGGSFLLGGIIGLIFSFLSRFLKNQTELLIYTLGVILLTAGLALKFHMSVLLACMFLSAVIVNTNKESFKFFEILNTVDWPIYLLFFVLAGANLEVDLLGKIGLIGIVYVVSRVVGKFIGTYIGARASDADIDVRRYLALAQLPQAGIALGMALIAKVNFPEFGSMIFTTIAATTIIYEIIGPFFVKMALQKAKQIE